MTTATTDVAGRTRIRIGGLSRFADHDRWLWRAMLTPAILYIILLVGFPFLLSLYYSVSSVTVASQDMHFVGLENFRRIVESSTFCLSLQNTIVITVLSQFFVLVFANILAGHIIIICLISLIFIFGGLSVGIGWGFSPVSLAFSVFIYLIEILVIFIQAFIFTNLTAVFIGQAIEDVHDHDKHQIGPEDPVII